MNSLAYQIFPLLLKISMLSSGLKISDLLAKLKDIYYTQFLV